MGSKFLCTALLFAMACSLATAQVSLNLQATDATCSSNGSLQATASGGSGNYSFQLSSGCLPVPVFQQSNVFNNLAPCLYTVVVTDGSSGASVTQTVTVGGNYQSPSLTLDCGACSLEVDWAGGLAPFSFAISTGGLNGPYQLNSPASNPVFQNIPTDSVYWIKVTDGCGNVAVESCLSGAESIEAFTYEIGIDGKIHVLAVTGGTPPYTYKLQSTNGSFTNSSGVFAPITWGCSMNLTVSDGCSELSQAVAVKPVASSFCSNFSEGTATAGPVVNGVPPYTYICSTPAGNFTFTTNQMTGLPVNADYYQFQVKDACGNYSDPFYKQKKYPIFQQDPVSCTEKSIGLYTNEGGCGGGFDFDSWPITVFCLSCSPADTGVVSGLGDVLTFQGNDPGNWVFAIEDGCSDNMVCHDTIVLEILPQCDSLQARLVDRFLCDNSTVSDRPMSTGNALFVLKNESGNIVGTNQTGLFHVPVPGNYSVSLSLPGCGQFSATALIGEAPPIEPSMSTYLYNAVLNGICQPLYQLVISPADGPYTLTGGPNNIDLLLDESFLTGSCLWYSITNLLPGDYELSPVSNCGIKLLHLPAPAASLAASAYGNCPGSGTITVAGAGNLAYWQQWAADNNASSITWPSSINDSYSLDAVNAAQSPVQVGSPFVFGNVPPGEHTVYLYNFNSACPIDTLIVNVPEAETLTIDVSSGLLCDGASTTSLQFEMLTGKGPYTIEQVDCSDPSNVLATYATNDSLFSIPGFALGDYCFRVIDSCVISLDHQFSVQYYRDSVDVVFHCDNTITLLVDSLNAAYTWFDANGQVVGNSHDFTFPNPGVPASFTVAIDLGECVITRQVTVPATAIVPTVSVAGQPFFCQGATVALAASSDAPMFLWNNGGTTAQVSVTTAGWHAVTVTNGLGCTAVDSFLLQLNQPVVNIEVVSGGSGFGLDCWSDSNGVLLAQPVAGFAPFSFLWSNAAHTQGIQGLAAGHFSITVTDSLGCTGQADIALTEPDLFVPAIHQKPPFCFGNDNGLLEIKGWAGGAGSVKATLNGSIPLPAPIRFDNLPPGHYLLEVWDANGCQVDTGFVFAEQKELLLDLGEDLTVQLGDSIYLEPFLNFWPVDSFLWRSNDPNLPQTLSPVCVPIDNFFYQLQVWDDHGCSVEDKVSVRVEKPGDLYVPNAFSPNGDGVNDFFTVYARTPAVRTVRRFQVFSRWGEMVFEQENFQPNIERMGWDGYLKNKNIKPGVFAWKAEVEFIDGRIERLFGDVSLVK